MSVDRGLLHLPNIDIIYKGYLFIPLCNVIIKIIIQNLQQPYH